MKYIPMYLKLGYNKIQRPFEQLDIKKNKVLKSALDKTIESSSVILDIRTGK